MGMHVIVFDKQIPPEDFDFYHVDISNDEEIKAALSHIPHLDIVIIASCLGLVPELTSPLYCTTKAEWRFL